TPCGASVPSRRSSSGTTASRRSRSSSPKPIGRALSRPRCSMPTPSLRELQGLFWDSIAGPPHGLGLAPALLEVAEPSATLDPAARLRVYADAYFWHLQNVQRIFPASQQSSAQNTSKTSHKNI